MEEGKIAPRHFDKLPFEIIDEVDESIKQTFSNWSFVRVGPKKFVIQAAYKQHGLDIYNFEARADDVYLIGFPRSGTTLHCEMIWQIGNNLDFKKSEEQIIERRFPYLDFPLLQIMVTESKVAHMANKLTENLKDIVNQYSEISLEFLNGLQGRRFIRSHLPISLIPPDVFKSGAKVIYSARNPKDVIVSMYHVARFFYKSLPEEYNFETFFKWFKEDIVLDCPYFEHVKEAWEKRNDDNFLFLFYEDTIKDKKQTMKKIANFLDKDLSENQFKILEDYLNIENFRKNDSVNKNHLLDLGLASTNSQFIRKGKVGGWRELIVGDLEKEVNEWIAKNLEGTDLRFPEC